MFKSLSTYILILITIIGCNSSKESRTYFGGKIINPKSNFVILYSMGNVIDTLYLDKEGKFIGEYKNVNEGLYYFEHGIENQYIYLEPLDSLMLRLNTWDFDESLVFAGKGAERNNILIDCFLENEKENKMFYQLNKLEPKVFKKKIDSLLYLKEITYKDYVLEHPDETVGFNNLLNVALTYPIYARIERYPILHIKYTNKKDFHQLDNSFYKYRKHINFNNNELMYYPQYSQYIRNYLYNTTYSLGHKPMTDEYSSNFTIDLLKTIDSKLKQNDSKNAFLKQTVIGHFYQKSSCDINKDAFDTYFDLSTNKKDIDLVKQLICDNNAVQKNQKINDFNLYDLLNGKHSIKDLTKNKNCFLLFWNPEYISSMYISSRVKYLSNRFPEIHFIQIKIDGDSNDRIHKLDIKSQYYIDAKSEANNFLTSKMPRSIIINKEGIIKNGFASISSRKIHSQLKELNKK
jgi:hypothetical protein